MDHFDFLKNLVVSRFQTIRIGAVVVVAGTDAVSQPVFIGILAGCASDFITRTGTVDNGKIFTVSLIDIHLNGLSAHVHTDGKNLDPFIFDGVGHVARPNSRFVGITGAIRARLV